MLHMGCSPWQCHAIYFRAPRNMLLLVVHIATRLISFGDSATGKSIKDPISVADTVFIRADRSEFANTGRKEMRISLPQTPSLLTQELQQNAHFFKEYGVSGSATVSKRGADATQTQVLWNGLPINHPMLGMMDFNSVGVFGMEELVVIEGGNSAIYGSGSVGGTVMLNNRIQYNTPLKVQGSYDRNSLNNQQASLAIRKGWYNAYINVTGAWMDRQNQFEYVDPILQKKRRSFNSELESRNIRLVSAVQNAAHQLKFISELGTVNRGLGFLLGADNPLGSQFDWHSRQLLQYDFQQKDLNFSQKIGHTYDQLVYQAQDQAGDTSQAEMTFLQSEWYINSRWGRALFGLDYQIQKGNSQAYEGRKQRVLPAFFSAWKANHLNFSYLINARYEFHEGVFTSGLGTQTKLNSKLTFKTDIHRSFRRPTLNDLYWSAPNRQHLEPEMGWGGEMGIAWQPNQKGKIRGNLELTPFYRELNNPIIWLPSGTFWSARNLDYGTYLGMQVHAHVYMEWGKLKWNLSDDFEYVYSQVRASKNTAFYHQIFVPDVMNSFKIEGMCNAWAAKFQWQQVGNRYTASDNSQFLPMYSLFSMEASYSTQLLKDFDNTRVKCAFGIQNLSNTIYQNMPGRPMPPRNMYLNLTLAF